MKPTIGRVVIYKPTAAQIVKMANAPNCNTADFLPATVVAVWGPTTVNLKVHLDGEGDLWVTSASEGTLEGQWMWPIMATDMPHSDAPSGDAKVS